MLTVYRVSGEQLARTEVAVGRRAILHVPPPPRRSRPWSQGNPAGGRKRRLPLGFVRAAAYRTRPWVMGHRAATGIPSLYTCKGGAGGLAPGEREGTSRTTASRPGLVWAYGMAWHGMAWHEVAWHGMQG